uniref:hypothetical protein n=1 Tax=uncultured Dysgonomonas sp. TaxID=206096 RepID=UPI0026126DA8|nr:hypothetical protein [uncultured Dysgonomonas sp.]
MKLFIISLLAILFTFLIVSCSKDEHDFNPEEERREEIVVLFKSLAGNTYTNPNATFDVRFKEYNQVVGQAISCNADIIFKEESFTDTLKVVYLMQDKYTMSCSAYKQATLTYISKDILTNELGYWKRKTN